MQWDLYKEAEKRLNNDQIGLIAWSEGGFSQCYAFVCPYVKEGTFGWILKKTNYQPEHIYSMDIPAPIKAIPRKELPTLEKLPTPQLLIPAKKKQ